ncbi:MAG: hypothetical protein ABT20_14470 [Rubrivivax sp. SCN 70-15]|nr:MAG: hypothetical protein ABT20_14470 [Rubrivivax sp. SCN 70-15]
MNKLRLGPGIGLAFTLVIALMLVVAGTGIVGLREVNQRLHAVTDDYYVKVRLVSQVQNEIDSQARRAYAVISLDQADKRADEIAAIRDSRSAVAKQYEQLTPLVTSAESKAALADIQARRQNYRASLHKFVALATAGQLPDAKTLLLGDMRAHRRAYAKVIGSFAQMEEKLMTQASTEADAQVQHSLMLVTLVAALAALLGMGAAWLIVRSITRPVADAVRLAEAVAEGDLTVHIDSSSSDEVGQLLAALRRMNDSLVAIVGQVRQSSDSIATGSSQIATGNADLSQRTEEQASNLQQTAASMEQLTPTVTNNADTARQAAQLAHSASGVAAKGGDVVGQVVTMMQDVTAASRRIADIIGTIDGIAFQTNILALNAAVEAARADEQGRGFAVVAGEVRTLAQRSAEAAREIRGLIGAKVEKVERGSVLVDEAGTTMQDIVGQVKRVNDLLGDISAATQEQTSGIGQVTDAVMQLDQVTQQNAALVEESAAAADSLNQQARNLVTAVARFKLAAGAMGMTTAAPAPAPRHPVAHAPLKLAHRPLVKPAAKPVAKAAPAPAPEPATAGDDDWQSF